MITYLEHANLTVPDIDAAIEFLKTVDPSMVVMWDETREGDYRWAHVGVGDCYIALATPHLNSNPTDERRPYKDYGINHLGWVVNDLDEVIKRVEARGYRKGIPGEHAEYRRRVYYYDSAGFEWELIEYLTENYDQRFSYE